MTNVDGMAGGKVISGIGGWLLLPLLGLCLSPLLGAWNLWNTRETLSVLDQLEPLQSGFIILETLVNLLLQVVAAIYLLVQMLNKRAAFPRLYQYWLGVSLVFQVLDLVLAYALFPQVFASGAAELLDSNTVKPLVQGVIGAAIWIPYMARSVRVRNTFVN